MKNGLMSASNVFRLIMVAYILAMYITPVISTTIKCTMHGAVLKIEPKT